MSPGNWQKMVSRLRQFTNIWKANKYWKKGCPAFTKLTSLWRDGLALVEGVDQGGQENCGLWPVSWVIAKSFLLTLGADLDLKCEDRIWEVCPCRIFFLWGFGSWVCGRTITSTITTAAKCLCLLTPSSSPKLPWLKPSGAASSAQASPPCSVPQLLWDKVYCGLISQLSCPQRSIGTGLLACPTASSCPPLQPLGSAGAPFIVPE